MGPELLDGAGLRSMRPLLVSLAALGDVGAVPALIKRLVKSTADLGRLRAAQGALKGLTKTDLDRAPLGWRQLWAELLDSRQGWGRGLRSRRIRAAP